MGGVEVEKTSKWRKKKQKVKSKLTVAASFRRFSKGRWHRQALVHFLESVMNCDSMEGIEVWKKRQSENKGMEK